MSSEKYTRKDALKSALGTLGVSAFAIDVGFAYYAKRQLQTATDAAALAGAQDLPNVSLAFKTADEYAKENTPSARTSPATARNSRSSMTGRTRTTER